MSCSPLFETQIPYLCFAERTHGKKSKSQQQKMEGFNRDSHRFISVGGTKPSLDTLERLVTCVHCTGFTIKLIIHKDLGDPFINVSNAGLGRNPNHWLCLLF